MKAVILAGGKGTRLADFTREVPKPMLKVGSMSILEHQVNLLVKYQVSEIIILVNYLKDIIMSHFGDGSNLGIPIRYFEEEQPLGTVGGIKEIEEWLTEDFFVLYGDVMVNMDLDRLVNFHQRKKAHCTLVLHPNDHPFDSDLVEINGEGRVTAFLPKPHAESLYYKNLVNAGLYIFSPSILELLEKGKKADFGREVFPAIFRQVQMFGYVTTEYLKDMGTPDRWRKVNQDFKSGKIDRLNLENPQKAIFLDRDGVLNVEKSFISRTEDLEIYDFTPGALRKVNQSDYLSIVITNQSVIARNLCTLEELAMIHKKLETHLGNQHAYLDAIYYCPHHPDKGFPEERMEYKIDCDCRKPKIGLFEKAARHFHVDLAKSWMIGDAERDIIAGNKAGCATIGVMTGFGLTKSQVKPDFFFPDLAAAVSFIVDDPWADEYNVLRIKIEKTQKRPVIIAVGGNTRSGKSNFASYLRLQLMRAGYSVLKIELDDWIVPESDRVKCKNVYDRFRSSTLEKDLMRILDGELVSVNPYKSHPDRAAQPKEYQFNNEQILIIEGIVALGLHKVRQVTDISVFFDIEETLLRERFDTYYRWKKKLPADIEPLFHKRVLDEYQLIDKDRKFADFIINASRA